MPGVSPGDGQGPGCFTHLKGVRITTGQLFWWECIMTFVLVSVVYATAVTKPGHGSMAPLAIGFTLYASAAVGESTEDLPKKSFCQNLPACSTFPLKASSPFKHSARLPTTIKSLI